MIVHLNCATINPLFIRSSAPIMIEDLDRKLLPVKQEMIEILKSEEFNGFRQAIKNFKSKT